MCRAIVLTVGDVDQFMDAWLARKHALFGRLITKNAVAAARARKSTPMNLGSGNMGREHFPTPKQRICIGCLQEDLVLNTTHPVLT